MTLSGNVTWQVLVAAWDGRWLTCSADRGFVLAWLAAGYLRDKVLIRLAKSVFFMSGKATTRSKRRITPALRVPVHLAPNPRRGSLEEKVSLP